MTLSLFSSSNSSSSSSNLASNQSSDNKMSFTSRQVDKLVLSRAQREGVGATVRRSIGGGEVSPWSSTTEENMNSTIRTKAPYCACRGARDNHDTCKYDRQCISKLCKISKLASMRQLIIVRNAEKAVRMLSHTAQLLQLLLHPFCS
jgi:hypothetical protein